MFSILPWVLTVALLPSTTAPAPALAPQTPAETLLLQSPTVSERHVVFVYAGDLWIVGREGGDARRLTSDRGLESAPRLSPDGAWVAYSAQYDGNTDVYLLPIEGGSPKRLTWHPGRDTVQDWHPAGDKVLFSSARDTGTGVTRLFEVSTSGGTPEPLPIPRASHASYSPDASHIAYTPYRDAFWSWKRYRGGRVNRVWIYDTATHAVEEIPRVNASDSFPAFLGGDVFFASDRTDRMALYRFEPGSDAPVLCSTDPHFDVRSLSAGGGVVAFERAGAIHLFDPATQKVTRLRIRVMADGLAGRPRWQDVSGHVRSAALAPNGKRAAFEARGEIITVPREHGDARNLTRSPGVHERNPAWSPDGESIAWFSDEGGEYQLWVRDREGKSEPRSYTLGDGGFYYGLQWSPDGRHLLFQDKRNRLAYLTLETGRTTTVAVSEGSLGVVWISADWSPDSKWIAFEQRNSRTLYDRIALYRCSDGSVTTITDGFGESSDPAFSSDGKLLVFTSSVESGPTRFGLDMETSAARTPRSHLYAAVLQGDAPHPFAPRNDTAVDNSDAKKKGENGNDRSDDDSAHSRDDKPKEIPPVDLAGIDQRIVAVPLPAGRYWNPTCTADALYVLERRDQETVLLRYDLEDRESKTVATEVSSYELAHDEESLLLSFGGRWEIRPTRGEERHSLAIDGVKVKVDPSVEWPQMLREAWRIERDYFYDPGMHGVDWDAMWDRWSAFLPHVRHRSDLTLLLAEMIGELACGHNYVSGGEYPDAEDGVPTGLLGADFVAVGNRFRVSRILRGQNWNPDLRAPLTVPGVDVREGDYLIAVDGAPVTTDQNLFSAFENTADRQIEITVSSASDGRDPRTARVVPIRSEWQLRRLSWVEENRRRVEELSGGRLAYVYMPNTGNQGMAAFDRDYYSQLDKQGLVLDERFNGGGKVADYVVHVLSRETLSFWMNREQWVGRSPFGMIAGPKVMIVNERAGSGGDWMPWAFQRMGLGPLVGTRTWGGLVGISGYPPLMDGGRVTAASFGVMDPEGEWAVENVGVAPDFEVIQWPAEVIAGRDPQLEKAVELALRALEENPPTPLPKFKPPKVR